jgi:hypothetical protein
VPGPFFGAEHVVYAHIEDARFTKDRARLLRLEAEYEDLLSAHVIQLK